MLEGLEIDESKFGGIYLDSMNREQEMYILPEREGMILASGYDVKLRAMIVDAFLDAEPEQISDAERLMIVLQTTVANEKMVKKIEQTQNLIEEAQESMSVEIKELKTNIEQQNRGIKDTIPRKGFKAIEGIYKRARLSRQMIKVVLERFGVPVCYCSKYVDEVKGFNEYKAYNLKDYLKMEKLFISKAVQETDSRWMHPEYAKRFFIREEEK